MHGSDFGARNLLEYERLADEFLSAPSDVGKLFECSRRRNKALVRYEPRTEYFGILKDGIIQTFFIPTPCAALPASLVGVKKCHPFPTNAEYAQDACSN